MSAPTSMRHNGAHLTSGLLALLVVVMVTCAVSAPGALAQTPAPATTATPNEWPAEARRAYAQGLKDARDFIVKKKFDEAIAVLDKLTAERPREPQARFLKGVALADAGKNDDAIVAYRGVISEYPELPEPHNNLAVLYAAKGEYELARNELETAINAAPDYIVAYENLGDVYVRLAEQSYERAVARDAKNRTAPPKLKVVSDVLKVRPKASAPAVTDSKANPSVAAPTAASTDLKAPEPAAATTQPLIEVPAIPTNDVVK